MPDKDKKPWEQYAQKEETSAKPWEQFSSDSESKKKVPTESNGPVVKTPGSSDSQKEGMQQPLVSSGLKEQGKLPDEADFLPASNPNVANTPSDDGVYKYKNNPNAGYKKEGGSWYVSRNNDGNFVKITEDADQRYKELDKNAVKVKDIEIDSPPSKTNKLKGTTSTVSNQTSKEDGVYRMPGNETAIYQVKNGQWTVSRDGSGNFQPLTQNISERVAVLNKQAKRDYNIKFDSDVNWQAEPANERPTADNEKQWDKAQELFDNTFKVYDKSDPIVKERESLDKISETLAKNINLPEELAVSNLNKSFASSPYPYLKFEEYGAGNQIKAINTKTGQEMILNGPSFGFTEGYGVSNSEEKLLSAFIRSNIEFDKYNNLVEKKNKLNEELQVGSRPEYQIREELEVLNKEISVEEGLRRGYAKSNSPEYSYSMYGKQLDWKNLNRTSGSVLGNISYKTNEYRDLEKSYNEEKLFLDGALKEGTITPEDYTSRINFANEQLNDTRTQLNEYIGESANMLDDMNKMAGSLAVVNSERGRFDAGYIGGKFLHGFLSFGLMLQDIHEHGKDADEHDFSSISENAGIGTYTTDWEAEQGPLVQIVGSLSEIMGSAVSVPVGGILTSPAKTVIQGGIKNTLTQSFKSLVVKGVTEPEIGMFANSYVNFREQIDGDERTADLPFEDKMLMSGMYAFVSSRLEKFGLTSSISKTPLGRNLTSYLIKNSLSSVPKGASAELIEAGIDNSIKDMIKRGVINITGASISEGTTEGLQELTDIGVKEAYDAMKGKDYFENPKDFSGVMDRFSDSFVVGMLGGTMLSTVSAAVRTPKALRTMDQLRQIEATVSDPKLKDLLENSLKLKVVNKQMSKDEAVSILNELQRTEGVLNSIPDDVRKNPEVLQLMEERNDITQSIAGKEPVLVGKEKARIEEINNRLKAISEDPGQVTEVNVEQTKKEQDAIQEREAESVDVREQARNGETMGSRIAQSEEITNTEDVSTNEQKAVDEEKIVTIPVYHGGSVTDLSIASKESPVFVSEDESQANLYAEGNEGEVSKFDINPETIAEEEIVYEIINNLGLNSKEEGWDVNDLNVYELLDNRFETSLSDEDIQTVYSELENMGYGSLRFTDSNLETLKQDIENIVVFNPNISSSAYNGNSLSIEDVKSLDTSDKTNLQKVSTFLSKIEESLDQFGKESLGVNLPIAVIKPIIKAIRVLVDTGVSLEKALKQVAKEYNVTEDDIVQTFNTVSNKKKQTTASEAAKSISKKESKKVVVDEMSVLKDQIKLEMKVAKEKGKQVKDVIKSVTDVLDATKTKGKIKLSQSRSILKRLNRVNMDRESSVNDFLDYVSKVVSDTEYAEKLDNASVLRKGIKRKIKSAKQLYKHIAKSFLEINPEYVENVDQYLEIAEMINKSMTKSRVVNTGGNVSVRFKEEEDVKPIVKFIEKQQGIQQQIYADRLNENYESVYGKKPKDSTDIQNEVAEESKKDEEETIDSKVQKIVQDRLNLLDSLLIDEDTPKVVKEAVKIDPKIISRKLAFDILDAVDSFIINGTYAGLNKSMAEYTGINNVKNSKLKGRSFRLLGIKGLGSANAYHLSNLNINLQRTFKGVNSALQFEKESGLSEMVNGSNKAETQSKVKTKEYINKFGKKKKFFKADNIFERGALAFLKRDTITDENNQEFERRKSLLLASRDRLLKSNDSSEVKKGELYSEVFDRLGLSDAVSIEEIESKVAPMNREAVDFMINMWEEKYDDMRDHALGFHNTILANDLNYTPDKFRKLEDTGTLQDEVALKEMGMSAFTNMVFDKNEAGVLMENTRVKSLPKDRVVDLDFDSSNFRSYELALNDLYTSEAVAQLNAYTSTQEYKDMIPVDNRKVLDRAMSDYQLDRKGKIRVDEQQMKFLNKVASFVASMGSARALVGVSQIPLQFVTASTNTIVNTGETYIPLYSLKPEVREFINRSGRAIANRGTESVSTIENADSIVDKLGVVTNAGDKVLKAINNFNNKTMKIAISNPDVTAARDAWIAYYKKSLKKQKLTLDLDGEVNSEAADYADAMVDRNMDVSDSGKRGKIFRSKESRVRLAKQILLPFSTFTINMKNRMWADTSILFNQTASTEDRLNALRSLNSVIAETAIFGAMRYAVGRLILEAALSYLDLSEEDEKEVFESFLKNQKTYVVGNALTDFLSPNPVLNETLLKSSNALMDYFEIQDGDDAKIEELLLQLDDEFFKENGYHMNESDDEELKREVQNKVEKVREETKFRFYTSDKASYGVLGVFPEKIGSLIELYKAVDDGSYETDFNGIKSEKFLPEKARKDLMLPLIFKSYATVFPPREFDQFSNKVFSITKKKYGMSESQKAKYDELKDDKGDVTEIEMKIIKSGVRLKKAQELMQILELNQDNPEQIKQVEAYVLNEIKPK